MFYISYYSNKDKKNIIRRGKIDKKCRLDTNKQGKPILFISILIKTITDALQEFGK